MNVKVICNISFRNFTTLNNTGKNNGAEFEDKLSDGKFLKKGSCFRNKASVLCFRDGGQPDGAGRQLLQSRCSSLRLAQRRQHGSRRRCCSSPAVRHFWTVRTRSGTVRQPCTFVTESELITGVAECPVMRGHVVDKEAQSTLNFDGNFLKLQCSLFLISNFRRVLDIVSSLLGVSPASDAGDTPNRLLTILYSCR
jgi:hypothetical protein